MNVGTKVKFKASYDGCFKEFKGKEFTVKRWYLNNDSDKNSAKYWIQLEEIDEVHLLKSWHFEIMGE